MLPIEATPALLTAAAVAALFFWTLWDVAKWARQVLADEGQPDPAEQPCRCGMCRCARPSRN